MVAEGLIQFKKKKQKRVSQKEKTGQRRRKGVGV